MNFKNGIKKIGAGLALSAMLLTSVVPINSFAADTKPVYTINIKAANNETDGAEYEVIRTKKVTNTGETVNEKTPVSIQKVVLKNGTAQVKVNEKGVYQLKPIRRAAGHLLDIRDDGKTAQVEFPRIEKGVESKTQSFEFQTKNRPLNIGAEFIKYGDDTVSPLEHVTFELRQTHKPKTIGNDNRVTEWESIPKETQDKNKQTYTTKADGKVVYNNLPEGKYELVETVSAEKHEVNKNVNTFTVTQENNKAVIKDSTITNVKKLVNYLSPVPEKRIVEPQGEVLENTINVETPYMYNLKVKAPTDIKEYTVFKMKDKLDDRLQLLDVLSVTQTGNDKLNVVTKEDLAKIVTIKGNELTVDLKSKIKDLEPGKMINVYAKAKVKGTVVTKITIENDYDLFYNNGKDGQPDVEHKKTSNKTKTTPHFGSVKFVKTQSDGKTPLDGAKFRIFRLDTEKPFVPVKPGDKTTETIKFQNVKNLKEAQSSKAFVLPSTAKEYADVVTAKDGVVEFKNLPYGEYVVYEIEAPDNYRIKEDSIPFTINEKTETITLQNVKNFSKEEVVPGTGTKGAMIFATIGIGLLAASYFVVKRQERKTVQSR